MILSGIIAKGQDYSLSFNVATAAVGSLNIEGSAAVNNKYTLHLPVSYNPIIRDFRHMIASPGYRYWTWHSYSGFFIGNYATFGKYNISNKDSRYYGSIYAVSLSVGYAKMISRNWNIEAEIGYGYGYVEGDEFEKRKCGDYLDSYSKFKHMPTKAAISIIYIF